jgi:hypothetical protein
VVQVEFAVQDTEHCRSQVIRQGHRSSPHRDYDDDHERHGDTDPNADGDGPVHSVHVLNPQAAFLLFLDLRQFALDVRTDGGRRGQVSE